MKNLLNPAIRLMQRLKLLPKFSLITLLFLIPLVVVTTMLFNELHHAMSLARAEKSGIAMVREIHHTVDLARKHRALQRMLLNHNQDAKALAKPVQQELDAQMAKLASLQSTYAAISDHAAFNAAQNDWKAIQGTLETADIKESYKQHTDYINRLLHYGNAVATRSNLSMDPGADSRLLVNLLMHTIPDLKESVAEMTGRGASIIDTGMFEPNEDVMLNAKLMLAKHELSALPVQVEAIYRENPALDKQLDILAPVSLSTATFLERARLEVLNSVDQTSGVLFERAGSIIIHDLDSIATRTADLLDGLLAARIRQQIVRAAWMLGIIIIAMMLAAYLLAGFYASFRRDIDQLESSVVLAAEGDLSGSIHSEGQDELAHIVNAFGDMTGRLAALIAEVQTGAMSIAAVSQHIATGNADLSARTQQQASSLQQTAASMEELNVTVQQNTELSFRVNQLSHEASHRAVDGGLSVTKVVETMSAITEASRKIEDIIAVIDGIAFQTNILALNAAVEAARAGQHGRGFAVVATEVRLLAQRSASAATEVKALIQNSLGTVQNGNRLVDQTRLNMDAIVSDIRHVSDIMGDMSLASQEQSSGIDQINTALTHMDHITQKNAALVEQLATDAELLHEHVNQLSQAVGMFKLDERMAHFSTEQLAYAKAEDLAQHATQTLTEPLMIEQPKQLKLKYAA